MAQRKRIPVTLDKEQIRIIESIEGLGTKDSERLKNIIIAYLSEKGLLRVKKRG